MARLRMSADEHLIPYTVTLYELDGVLVEMIKYPPNVSNNEINRKLIEQEPDSIKYHW